MPIFPPRGEAAPGEAAGVLWRKMLQGYDLSTMTSSHFQAPPSGGRPQNAPEKFSVTPAEITLRLPASARSTQDQVAFTRLSGNRS